jgi:DNA-binding NtrC family response regulator
VHKNEELWLEDDNRGKRRNVTLEAVQIDVPRHRGEEFIYASELMGDLVGRARRIAQKSGPVLITGESGTGKTALAAAIHCFSPRRDARLVCRGCGEFDASTIEATLFGHTKDAYTGSETTQSGLFAQADGGTLVLDDIDYLPIKFQSRLLRFLDDGTYYRLGDPEKSCRADVRIIVTTNKHLEAYIRNGSFLQDLFYRVQRFWLQMPPLRERPEDVEALAKAFLQRWYRDEGAEPQWQARFSSDAVTLLRSLPWPGNVRELHDCIENITLFVEPRRGLYEVEQVAKVILDQSHRARVAVGSGSEEDWTMLSLLESTGWNIRLVSRIMGRSRTTVYARIKRNGWSAPRRLADD